MAKLFVDDLTVIDFSYLHPQRGLVGESWQLDIELGGSLDNQGMVLDFGEVKRQVKQMIDHEFDHKLLAPIRYVGIEISENNQYCGVRYRCRSGLLVSHKGPVDASCLLDTSEITPESVAAEISARLQPKLPENVSEIKIRLHSEQRAGHYYHVSHGLKHHAGNCQRIAHGHRSYIEIHQDGKRSARLEAEWARRWRDIYIATREDLVETLQRDGTDYLRFTYRSQQGLFELELPKAHCYLIDMDSTVENLAQHIADALKAEHPSSIFQVRVFEGIGKGAVAG